MNKQLPFKRIAVAGLGAVLLTAGAGALADPPARVARLAYINGSVSFAPAGQNDWEYASVNRPLIAGDRLWVEAGARDEVQVGAAALRMGGNTLVTLLNMDDQITQLQLSQGRLNVRVRKLRPNDVFEIDTPNLALTIRQPGDYRIEVDPAGNATLVAVRSGQAEAYGDGNAYRLGRGQAYSFGGTDLRDVRAARVDQNDDFDRWSASRDRRIEQARSVRYVSPDLVGYEDLDDQGTWRTVPSYGNVWMPAHVGRDWAPYRDGHWTYVQPWGWTWVDDAPWGYAVSHYGRWSRFPEGWGWVPGPRAASPVYAPALVAFISIGAGAYAQRERPVAWFPLAPREVYRPSYRASPTYITNINVTNTVINRNEIVRDNSRVDYANRRVGGAVTAVPATAFVHAQPVSRAALAVPVAALAAAAIARNAPVSPERDSMRGHGNPGHQPPPAVMARQVLARTAPPSLLRHAPGPVANVAGQGAVNPPQAPQAAGPAPRVLPQGGHGGGRQMREVPPQPQGAAPNVADVRASQGRPAAPRAGAAAMPSPNGERSDRHGDPRMNGGQHGAVQAPAQAVVPPLANAPVPMPAQQSGHAGNRQPSPVPPPLPHAPTPVPAPLAHAPAAMPQPSVASNPAAERRNEMRQSRGQGEHSPRGMPPPPPQAAAAVAPPQAPPAPLQHGPERPRHIAAPPPPSPPPQAAAAVAPPQAPPAPLQHGPERQRHIAAPPPTSPPPQAAAAVAPPQAPPAPLQHGPERARHIAAPPPAPPPQQAAAAVAPPPPLQHGPERQRHNAAPPQAPQPAAPPPPPPQRPPEPMRHAPTPAPVAAAAPAPAPAAAPQAPDHGHGHGNEGKKGEKGQKDHPEQK